MKKKTTILLLFMLLTTQIITFCDGCATPNKTLEHVSQNSTSSEANEISDESANTLVSSDICEEESDVIYEAKTNTKEIATVSQDGSEVGIEPAAGSEEYAEITENKFISTKKNDTYTFSADVDTASYSNIRRMINDGCSIDEIPADAVRIEEMLNYFSYDYIEPQNNEPFGVSMQSTKCPWNTENNIVMIGLNTEKADFEDAPNSNLVFLLDVSGSMSDSNKLPLLTKAFTLLANELDARDKVPTFT